MIHLDTNYLIGLLVNQSDFRLFVPHGLKLAAQPPPPPAQQPSGGATS
jgi:hypothetical protein